MKNWLIPAVVLIAVGGMGLGVGWSINEWQGDDEAPAQSEQTGPTDAELDAQRCSAALQAYGEATGGTTAAGTAPGRIPVPGATPAANPILDAIDRYCH